MSLSHFTSKVPQALFSTLEADTLDSRAAEALSLGESSGARGAFTGVEKSAPRAVAESEEAQVEQVRFARKALAPAGKDLQQADSALAALSAAMDKALEYADRRAQTELTQAQALSAPSALATLRGASEEWLEAAPELEQTPEPFPEPFPEQTSEQSVNTSEPIVEEQRPVPGAEPAQVIVKPLARTAVARSSDPVNPLVWILVVLLVCVGAWMLWKKFGPSSPLSGNMSNASLEGGREASIASQFVEYL